MATKAGRNAAKAKEYQDRLLDQLVRLDPASKRRIESVLDKPENENDRLSVEWNMCDVECSVTLEDAKKLHERFLADEFAFDEVSHVLVKVLTDKRTVSYVLLNR